MEDVWAAGEEPAYVVHFNAVLGCLDLDGIGEFEVVDEFGFVVVFSGVDIVEGLAVGVIESDGACEFVFDLFDDLEHCDVIDI